MSAVVAGLCAIAVVIAPFGVHWIALVVAIVALFAAARLGARPGLFLTTTSLVAISVPVGDAFTLSRIERARLARAAEDGDSVAALVTSISDAIAGLSAPLIVLCLALVFAAIAVAALRARSHGGGSGWEFYLRESDALGAMTCLVGKAAAFLYVPLIIIIVYDVTQRKVLDVMPGFSGTDWYHTFTSTKLQEAEWHLHAILFLLCFGYAYVTDAHVRIELVRDRLAPRIRVWIELVGCLLFLVAYCYVVIRFGYEFAHNSYKLMEQSAAQTGLPLRFIIKSFLPLGFLILALSGVSVAVKCLVYLFGPASLRAASGYYAGTHHADIPEDVVTTAPADN